MPTGGRSLAVIGAGWAGLATAVQAVQAGHAVTVFEMALHGGGRARTVSHHDLVLDNGQHILIGAYRETLALLRTVGVDPNASLRRQPLTLVDPSGRGLRLDVGAATPAFAKAVLRASHWPWRARLALLWTAARWRLAGFRAAPSQSVADLTRELPAPVRHDLIEPLCVAALNTPAADASAEVFLRVMRDALFGGPGAADLLLPRVPLGDLLPSPAIDWLHRHGASVRFGHRVTTLVPASPRGWIVDGLAFDAVVLACSASQAARLAATIDVAWAACTAGLDYQPIVTVYLTSTGTRLADPMTSVSCSDIHPAQFVFDLGAIDGGGSRSGLFAFVTSGARDWLERGIDAIVEATLLQARDAFPAGTWRVAPTLVQAIAERRATFACRPALTRPRAGIAPGLAAAGDFVQGPYPATLEGAVMSARQALATLNLEAGPHLS